MNNKRLPLLIFDCDGVLVDSEPISSRVFTHCLQKEGYAVDEAYCNTHLYGISLRECLIHLETTFNKKLPPTFTDTLSTLSLQELRNNLQPIAHIEEALIELVDYPKCVASGSDLERINLSLQVTGLEKYFNHVFNSYQVEKGKPAPDIFLYAAEQMGYTPEACIVIEDSDAGVQAGVSAEMKVLLYRPHLEVRSNVPEGIIHFTDMKELPGLIRRISAVAG